MKKKFVFAMLIAAIIAVTAIENFSAVNIKYRCGDANGDGEVKINDAVEILKYVAELPCQINEGENIEKAFNAAKFMSGDKPTIVDAVEVLKYVAELPSFFDVPCECPICGGTTPGIPRQGVMLKPPGGGNYGVANEAISYQCTQCRKEREVCQNCGYCKTCEWEYFGAIQCKSCKWGGDCLAEKGVDWCYEHFTCSACCECDEPVKFTDKYPTSSKIKCFFADCDNYVSCEFCTIPVCADCSFKQYGVGHCVVCKRSGDCISADGGKWNYDYNQCSDCFSKITDIDD